MRYYGNHAGTRQVRGWRLVKPATFEERLASMQRELERRIGIWGGDNWLMEVQRQSIAKLIASVN